MLTADIINSWYSSDVTPGSSGVTLGSFATDEFFFNPAGKQITESEHQIQQ